MTKRFTLTNPKNAFQEMKCGIDDRGNTLTFNEVVGLLNAYENEHKRLTNQLRLSYDKINKLTEENRQLTHDASVLIQVNSDYRKEIESLKSSDTITDLETQIMNLKEENKFLRNKVTTYKSGNALLKKTLDKEWK